MKAMYLAATAGIIGMTALPLSVSAAQYGNRGQYGVNRGTGTAQQTQVVTTQLTAAEKATIQRTLEEEKLAGDLYRAFYDKWGTAVFSRIATSEDRHESAVLKLATAYGVTDARTNAAGTFTDPSLQALYNKLHSQGMTSEAAALDVAKQFEADDIAGLKTAQTATTVARLDRVFGNLQRASEYHLQEFTTARNALG